MKLPIQAKPILRSLTTVRRNRLFSSNVVFSGINPSLCYSGRSCDGNIVDLTDNCRTCEDANGQSVAIVDLSENVNGELVWNRVCTRCITEGGDISTLTRIPVLQASPLVQA